MWWQKRGPWLLATAQVVVAAGLFYWYQFDYAQALARINALSLCDYWPIPAGLLLILDLPAYVLMLPFMFVARNSEILEDLIFLAAVFVTWAWLGFLLRRQSGKVTRRRRLTNIAGLGACVLVAAASPYFVANLMVSRTLKILVVEFWIYIAVLAFVRALVRVQRPTSLSAIVD